MTRPDAIVQRTRSRGRAYRQVLWWGAVIFAAAQLIPGPPAANPPTDPGQSITAAMPVPRDVRAVLERSCGDCHSNHTRWPWYSRLAPGSFVIAGDVNRGRDALNFSEWTERAPSPEVSAALLAAACANVQSGSMPPSRYLLLHPSARLSEAEKRRFCEWTGLQFEAVLRARQEE